MDSVEKQLRQISDFDTMKGLPLGFYLVTDSGKLVDANRRCRGILGLPTDGDLVDSILQFYVNPTDRESLCKEADRADAMAPFLEEREIRFKVGNRHIWVSDTCRTVREPKSGLKLGYVGYLCDVNQRVVLRELFDQVPAALYRVDENGRILFVNDYAARILGFDSLQDIQGTSVFDLYDDPLEEEELVAQLLKKGSVHDKVVTLVKRDGEKIRMQVSARLLKEGEEVVGREGVMWDVTAEATYREILDQVPVGTYVVKMDGDNEIISACNHAFAVILGYSSDTEVKKVDIRSHYVNPEDHEEFLKALIATHGDSKPLVGHKIDAVKADGEPVTLEVSARCLTGASGQVVGRVGVIRDMSDEIALWDIRNDVGRTLHQYTSLLMMAKLTLNPLERLVLRDKLLADAGQSSDRLYALFVQLTDRWMEQMEAVISSHETSRTASMALSTEDVRRLQYELEIQKRHILKNPKPRHRMVVVRDSAAEIVETLAPKARNETLFGLELALYQAATELEALCCIMSTMILKEHLLEMEHQVRALRDYIISQTVVVEEYTSKRIDELVDQAIDNVQEYASYRKVEITFAGVSEAGRVKVRERAVVRAIANLLHNAVKYSWSKRYEKPVVRVRSYLEGSCVCVDCENFGVPITKEEIEQESVFDIGYRGIHSGDRGRMGTGMGCGDSRQVARRHGGDVVLKSVEIRSTVRRRGQEIRPHLTTATIRLPRQRE